MGRRSSRELVGEIASALTWNPKSITEISEEADADKKCVRQYLEQLKKLPNVMEVETGDGRERRFCKSRVLTEEGGGCRG